VEKETKSNMDKWTQDFTNGEVFKLEKDKDIMIINCESMLT